MILNSFVFIKLIGIATIISIIFFIYNFMLLGTIKDSKKRSTILNKLIVLSFIMVFLGSWIILNGWSWVPIYSYYFYL